MSIKIETSRAQLTAGTGLGVVAEIRNRSDATIYIQEKSVTMKIPAELEGPFSRGGSWWAFFPTEQHEGKPDVWDNTIALPSGDAYKVFWTRPLTEVAQKEASSLLDMVLGDAKSILYSIAAELNFTFFQPGDYTIAVVAKYWTDPKDVGHERYRTLTQSATFHFATPQFVVLLGAAFGGLSAYVIFPETRRRLALKRSERGAASSAREFLERVTNIGGAVLLAMITTILLSRVAETQFLILLFESLSTTSGVRWRLVSPRPIWARAISSRTFSQSPTSRTQERRPPPRPLPPRRQQLLRPRSHRYQEVPKHPKLLQYRPRHQSLSPKWAMKHPHVGHGADAEPPEAASYRVVSWVVDRKLRDPLKTLDDRADPLSGSGWPRATEMAPALRHLGLSKVLQTCPATR